MEGNKKRARPTDEVSLEDEQNEAAEKRRKQDLEEVGFSDMERKKGALRGRCVRKPRAVRKDNPLAEKYLVMAADEPVEGNETDSSAERADRSSYRRYRRRPSIQLGEYGFAPRWVVVPASPESQLKPHDDITVQPPTESLSARKSPSSSSSSPKMATLVWKFEPGRERFWDGLTEEELHEYAYKFLERAMRYPKFRDQFREHICVGSHAHLVEDVEDCLPPLPEPPATNLLGELEFSGPEIPDVINSPARNSPLLKAARPVEFSNSQLHEAMMRRTQGLDGACDLPPLQKGFSTGPIPLKNFEGFMGVGQTFDMPGYGLPGKLPQAIPDKKIRQHAKTKTTKPRATLTDTGRRQYATKSIAGKHLPKATTQGAGDDDDTPKPESSKVAEAHRRRLKDRDFRDKVMPVRTFRRLRPWAGARISKASIKEDDLSRLSRFPSAERAFAPRIGLKVSKGPLSNGATARPTASNGVASNGVASNGATTSSGTTAVRRNPHRTARNK